MIFILANWLHYLITLLIAYQRLPAYYMLAYLITILYVYWKSVRELLWCPLPSIKAPIILINERMFQNIGQGMDFITYLVAPSIHKSLSHKCVMLTHDCGNVKTSMYKIKRRACYNGGGGKWQILDVSCFRSEIEKKSKTQQLLNRVIGIRSRFVVKS